MGDLSNLGTKEALRVTDIFVSHTHMDHFVGFDQLLRIHLGRPTRLRFWGPPGIVDQVQARLGGYTWNLVGDYTLTLEVRELDGDVLTGMRFHAASGFGSEPLAPATITRGQILVEDGLTVTAIPLDHGIPSLGFRIEEEEQLNVDSARLEDDGLEIGPWVGDLKRSLLLPPESGATIDAATGDGPSRSLLLEDAVKSYVIRGPGHVIAYASDLVHSEENAQAVARLAAAADPFLCEAMYLDSELSEASARKHLTARQAGMLAARAGAHRLVLFHISPRYGGEVDDHLEQATESFKGDVGLG